MLTDSVSQNNIAVYEWMHRDPNASYRGFGVHETVSTTRHERAWCFAFVATCSTMQSGVRLGASSDLPCLGYRRKFNPLFPMSWQFWLLFLFWSQRSPISIFLTTYSFCIPQIQLWTVLAMGTPGWYPRPTLEDTRPLNIMMDGFHRLGMVTMVVHGYPPRQAKTLSEPIIYLESP